MSCLTGAFPGTFEAGLVGALSSVVQAGGVGGDEHARITYGDNPIPLEWSRLPAARHGQVRRRNRLTTGVRQRFHSQRSSQPKSFWTCMKESPRLSQDDTSRKRLYDAYAVRGCTSGP